MSEDYQNFFKPERELPEGKGNPILRRKPIKAQSDRAKLQAEYLKGVKAGFLWMQGRYDPDGPSCEQCGVKGNSSTLDLDHIIPRSKSGHDRPDNLQLLCNYKHPAKHDCHGQKHGQPEWSRS